MSASNRKTGIAVISILLVLCLIVGITLVSLVVTERGRAWSDDFRNKHAPVINAEVSDDYRNNHTPVISSVVEFPVRVSYGLLCETGDHIERHLIESKGYLDKHIIYPYEREEQTDDKESSNIETNDNNQPPYLDSNIDEHVSRSGGWLSNHIYQSQKRFDEWINR